MILYNILLAVPICADSKCIPDEVVVNNEYAKDILNTMLSFLKNDKISKDCIQTLIKNINVKKFFSNVNAISSYDDEYKVIEFIEKNIVALMYKALKNNQGIIRDYLFKIKKIEIMDIERDENRYLVQGILHLNDNQEIGIDYIIRMYEQDGKLHSLNLTLPGGIKMNIPTVLLPYNHQLIQCKNRHALNRWKNKVQKELK